jgi:hypothetical protein
MTAPTRRGALRVRAVAVALALIIPLVFHLTLSSLPPGERGRDWALFGISAICGALVTLAGTILLVRRGSHRGHDRGMRTSPGAGRAPWPLPLVAGIGILVAQATLPVQAVVMGASVGVLLVLGLVTPTRQLLRNSGGG